MIKINNQKIEISHFPDHTLLLKHVVEQSTEGATIKIYWHFENNEELVALYFLTRHLLCL